MNERNLWKGLIAGAIAGLIATAAKSAAENFYPARIQGEADPREELADKLAGHSLHGTEQAAASEAIHWGFGMTVGAFYGALAELYPAATAKDGAAFGLTLMALTHEGALPAMGLSAEPDDQTPREQSSEAATHVVYGVVAEKVRHAVRGMLD